MLDFVLEPGRDRALRNRHPWLLSRSGEVRGAGDAAPGSSVRVVSSDGEVLGYGDLSPASSLRVRVHHFGKEEPAEDWFVRRVEAAIARRAGDPSLAATDAHRLVNAEGDGLPGFRGRRDGCLQASRHEPQTGTLADQGNQHHHQGDIKQQIGLFHPGQ